MAAYTTVHTRMNRLLCCSKRKINPFSLWGRFQLHSSNYLISDLRNDYSQEESFTPTHQYQRHCIRHYTTTSTIILPSRHPQLYQTRNLTIPTLCAEYTPTLWGLTPFLLTTFHSVGIPYCAGISFTNILARTSMIPLVIQGAKTQIGIGVVAPEVQFLITSFRNDMMHLKRKEDGTGMWQKAQMQLIKMTVELLRGIFKLHKVNVFDVFKSPLLQVPIFWYFSLDLRHVINGADPILAQALVESSFLHITDLTEPDPYYILPILTGALLYFNVETAVGKRALSGETSSHSNLAVIMKDFFQSLSIFMPCFMVQQPSGVQIYLMTSMIFTLCQSYAMRNDDIRAAVGLPPIYTKPKNMEEGKFIGEWMKIMKERQEAKARGEFVLAEGVTRLGADPPTLGKKRKSTIELVKSDEELMREAIEAGDIKATKLKMPLFLIDSLMVKSIERFDRKPVPIIQSSSQVSIDRFGAPDPTIQRVSDTPLDLMEKANRGEKNVEVEVAPKEALERNKKSEEPIDIDKFKMKRYKRGKGGKKGK